MNDISSKTNSLKKQGKKVIGCFPLYPPVELFHSLGLTPVTLWELKNDVGDTMESDSHVQNYVCSVARCLTQILLGPEVPQFDGLFMYNACDTLRNLPEIIEEGQMERQVPAMPFFKLHIPAIPPEQAGSIDYLKQGINELISELTGYFDLSFSGEAFKQSTAIYADVRDRCREAETMVARGQLSFARFSQTCCQGYRLPVETHLERLNQMITDAQNENTDDGLPGIIVSGILSPSSSLSNAMEAAGLKVVGNDIATLYRSYGYSPPPSDNPADYYADFYSNHIPCTTILPSADQRLKMLLSLAKEKNARGIIFIGEKFCEHEYFEFPFIQKMFRQAGLPSLLLEIAHDDQEDIEALNTRIQAWAEILHG